MVFFTFAVSERYHLGYHEEVPVKEVVHIFVISFFELMAKLFLWGYFVS